jgi:peptide/nickel transport system substrate-binding protein
MVRAGLLAATGAALLLLGCRETESGPVAISAIGAPPTLANPNRVALDPPSALLAASTAQGLVRFDPAGQIEPALAQSWTVTDDGTSYIFRIGRTEWPGGGLVTAQQVALRLRAVTSRASRNRLKPLLGAIAEIVAMTDRVIEIRLRSPRPNFLQLLAQPEMAIIRGDQGTGPFVAEKLPDGAMLLRIRPSDDEEASAAAVAPEIMLRGEPAALAIVRFRRGLAAMVAGGTVADLPLARAAELPPAALRFDPAGGMFGLVVAGRTGLVASAEGRRALSMAIDRDSLILGLDVSGLAPRTSLVPPGIDEQPVPALPAWAPDPLPARQAAARALVDSTVGEAATATLRVAMPEGPGARLIFAHLRRDWRAIGVEAEQVGPSERADLRFVDEVAPANLASWYLRHFTCDASIVCNTEADAALEAARNAPAFEPRREALAAADRLLTDAVPFIPLAAPVRWSLVSPRLTGFQPNVFGIHSVGSLIAPRR